MTPLTPLTPMTSMPLITSRCFLHPLREAVARCPECARNFCRECITEHDDRISCAACLRKRTAATEKRPRIWRALLLVVPFVVGLFIAWLCFYGLARALLWIPSSFHNAEYAARWWEVSG